VATTVRRCVAAAPAAALVARRAAAPGTVILGMLAVHVAPVRALQPTDLVKISEVCYDPGEVPETSFEFIELFNAGPSTVFLDGAVLSDQGNNGSNETTFQFPGTPLVGTTIALAPGEFMVIVGSATGSAYPNIDFECFGGGMDTDDPNVPNLVKSSGFGGDLGLANTGDGLTLSSGVSAGNVIPCAEIVDGVSWEDGGGAGEVTSTSRMQCSDPAAHPEVSDGPRSLQRRHDSDDTDRSATDFGAAVRTPGASAPCTLDEGCIADLEYKPCVPLGGQQVTVSVRLATTAGWTMRVFHKVDGAVVYDSVPMFASSDTTFEALLPGRPNLSRVLYYVQGSDPEGNVVFEPPSGGATPADYRVGIVLIPNIQANVVADSCGTSIFRGQAVNVRGVATHHAAEFDPSYFFLQRGTTANSGIRVATLPGGFVPAFGDSVQVSGVVDEVDCQTQIVLFPHCGQVLRTGRAVRPRLLLSPQELALEENESVLVKVFGPFTVSTPFDTTGGNMEFRITSPGHVVWVGGDTFEPDMLGYPYQPQPGDVLDAVTGIAVARPPTALDPVTRVRIEPRRDNDVDLNWTDSPPPVTVVRPFRIGRNVPNPFNPATEIEYDLDAPGTVHLRIYDAAGRCVRTLVAPDRVVDAGAHRVVWDGRDDAGQVLSSGLYVVRLESGSRHAAHKMLLLK
jgi:hypothetical protein